MSIDGAENADVVPENSTSIVSALAAEQLTVGFALVPNQVLPLQRPSTSAPLPRTPMILQVVSAAMKPQFILARSTWAMDSMHDESK